MTIGRHSNSENKEWNTPPEILEPVNFVFNGRIDLDPCSNKYSLVNAATNFVFPEKDGLKESWNYKTIYVNPPYGRNKETKTSIKSWIIKCVDAYELHKSEVIALIPVATNTTHWQDWIFPSATQICFLKIPRLKFYLKGVQMDKGAPMACAVIYWGTNTNKFLKGFDGLGKVILL